ncbi:spermidine synthase [Corynebacterium tapiri]|uniref:Spermidine synthase n=1 Tax=Corynebacterium tapiri TaxID=1448266 RepID=A0A5C4U676_9CORY|nr:fused MFS/spermidine synthase [Corynebacterium tapiri]TNL99758.1 spermidine synthase [Corynebacterium tapiri]
MSSRPDLPHGPVEISTGTAEFLSDDYRPGSYILQVNGVPSSHFVPGDPSVLEFEYMRWIASAVVSLVDARFDPRSISMTHLGGAGCTLPKYFADRWPKSRHSVVEIDARLAELVRTHCEVPSSPTVKIRVGDAIEVARGFKPATRDVLIRDVFSGSVTPRPLTTVEFFTEVATSLRPHGFYVANCGSHSDLAEVRAELAGMQEAFAHCAAIADPAMLKGRRYGNVILIGSQDPIEFGPEVTRELLGGAVPAHVATPSWIRSMTTASARRFRADDPAGKPAAG